MAKDLLTIVEAANKLGIRPAIIRKRIRDKIIPATKANYSNPISPWLIDPDKLKELIADGSLKRRKTYTRKAKSQAVISIPMEATLGAVEPRNTSSRAVIIITQTDSLNLRNMLSEVFS